MLLLVFPYISSSSPNGDETSSPKPKNVSVIELTPAEQSRLPDQSSSLSSIPEFPDNPLGDVPVIDSPAFESSFPEPLSSLPAPPALPPLPPLSSSYNNNYSRIPTTPLPSSRPIAPPPIRRPPIANLPDNRSTPDQIAQTEVDRTPPRPEFAPLRKPIPIDDLINYGKNGRTNNNEQPEEIAANPSTSSESKTPNQTRKDQIIGRLMDDIQEGAESLTYNPKGTRSREGDLKDAQWQARTAVSLDPKQMITLQGTYPKAACNLRLQGEAFYNVKVDSQGNLARQPFMTRSSGYPVLNNQGLQDVRSHNFSKSTRVKVVFEPNPDICPPVARTEPPQTPALPGNNTEKPPVETAPVEVRKEPPQPIPTTPEEKPPVETAPVEVRKEPPQPIPTTPEEKPPVETAPVEV
ncbi:MAG: energy transducer TonB, partial [Cyanobacteria bacterium P01_G01_bin.49]